MNTPVSLSRALEDQPSSMAAESNTERSPELSRSPLATHGVALLTGGDDKPYVLGLSTSLAQANVLLEVIGSDAVDSSALHETEGIRFLNLRGNQSEDAPITTKVARILRYYLRLISYAFTAKPKIFHILWNNKFEWFDRTFLMLYYRCLAKKIAFTAHNVNAAKRDGVDTFLNRISLRIQYRLSDHIFVHTEKMKLELTKDFSVSQNKVTVIPFGINSTVPSTTLTSDEARSRLGLKTSDKSVLFFGQIAPYKGLEYLVAAAAELINGRRLGFKLVIAGRVKSGHEEYWSRIQRTIDQNDLGQHVLRRIEHIPDSDVEVYFKAADVVVLPYLDIFQSGVPFLSYNFGLPVIAANVGSLAEDVVEGRTGFMFKAGDSRDLAITLEKYFQSSLYLDLASQRPRITAFARDQHSWATISEITLGVYRAMLSQRARVQTT